MKYHEWCNGLSLFGEIEKLQSESIISLLGAEQLNFLYMIRFGSRELVPSLEHVSVSATALMIQKLYLEKWEKLAALYLNDFEIGFDNSTTVSTTQTGNNSKDLTSSGAQNVSAFNDDELSPSNSNSESLNEVGTSNVLTETTTTKLSFTNVERQRALLENSHIASIICNDVACLLSLAIY